MIYHVISSDYMPPWPADPNYSNFIDEKFKIICLEFDCKKK